MNLWSIPVSTFKILRSAYRARTLNTQRETIQILRWQSEKPARLADQKSFSLFYRPQAIKAILFTVFLGALVIWTIKNYIEIIRSFA